MSIPACWPTWSAYRRAYGHTFDELLNKRSGLLGLSGMSGDMREIEQAAAAGDHRALVSLKAFCYRVRKYIGAYVAAMGGLDVIVFTGGIGQGSAGVRSPCVAGAHCAWALTWTSGGTAKPAVSMKSAASRPTTLRSPSWSCRRTRNA